MEHPIHLGVSERLVWSPHTYGPSQHKRPEFKVPEFPNNMPDVWEHCFGRILQNLTKSTPAVVLGEWGGPTTGTNGKWMSKLVSYLHSRDITSNFFWHIGMDGNPTGIVKDWTTFPPVIDAGKLNLLRKLVPKPTRILDHIPSAERNRERTSDLELREECIDGVCRSAGPGRRRRLRRRRVRR